MCNSMESSNSIEKEKGLAHWSGANNFHWWRETLIIFSYKPDFNFPYLSAKSQAMNNMGPNSASVRFLILGLVIESLQPQESWDR